MFSVLEVPRRDAAAAGRDYVPTVIVSLPPTVCQPKCEGPRLGVVIDVIIGSASSYVPAIRRADAPACPTYRHVVSGSGSADTSRKWGQPGGLRTCFAGPSKSGPRPEAVSASSSSVGVVSNHGVSCEAGHQSIVQTAVTEIRQCRRSKRGYRPRNPANRSCPHSRGSAVATTLSG